jgi:hypothetical protein
LTYLTNQKQQKILELSNLRKEQETSSKKLAELQSELSQLRLDKETAEKEIADLKIKESEQKKRSEKEFDRLAGMLNVEAHAEEVLKAIENNEKKLVELQTALSEKKTTLEGVGRQIEDSEKKKKALEDERTAIEKEIAERLKIKNYVSEAQQAMEDLLQQKASLEKEVEEKRERLALADTMTNFFTKRSDYDFNRFCSWVGDLKRTRENRPRYPSLIFRTEETIRMEALKAFEGDLISKPEYKALWDHKERIRKKNVEFETKVQTLEGDLKKKDEELDGIKKEKEFLEGIKVCAEGKQMTIKEIGDCVIARLKVEIERAANEKSDQQTARTRAFIEWIADRSIESLT